MMTNEDFSALRHRFGLTVQEAQFVRVLMDARNTASRDEILDFVTAGRSSEPFPKIVDVLACRVRRKFKETFGRSAITTIWGRGYAIDEAMKARIRAHLEPREMAA